MSSSTLGTRFGRRHRMTRAIIKIALTVLVAALAQLTGATALKGSANTQDDRYIAALAQRSVPVPASRHDDAISLGDLTVQKITAGQSDQRLAITATKLWQIAQQDWGYDDTRTPTAQQFVSEVMNSAVSVYSPVLTPVVTRWMSNHPQLRRASIMIRRWRHGANLVPPSPLALTFTESQR
jgi:hypothetical protein